MYLNQIKVSALRNLQSATLQFSPQFNWIYGINGSGKTSLLETIYLLSTGRSFRTRNTAEFIQEGQVSCVVSGNVLAPNGPHTTRFGIERHRTEGLRLRLNEQPFNTLAEWVKIMPLQLINVDSFLLLHGAPKPRRQFLDWAMFHVEHTFYSYLQRYRRALKQRNAALKGPNKRNRQDVELWNPELILMGEAITEMRRRFLQDFSEVFADYLGDFLSINGVNFEFKQGWNDKKTLSEALSSNFERDLAFGYTGDGPHRADFGFVLSDGAPVESRLSRGQLKMFISALFLARSAFVTRLIERAPLCLVDDLCSELDSGASARLLQGLLAQKAQIFVTSIDKNIVSEQIEGIGGLDYKMFHVEHGCIVPV